MRRRNYALAAAAAAILLASTTGLSNAADDPKPTPAPSPDSFGEPAYGTYDPGHEAGRRLTDIVVGSGAQLSDGRLRSLDVGIIGVAGSPQAGYTVYTGADIQANTVLSLVSDGLSARARDLVKVEQTTVSAAALQDAWLKVSDQAPALLKGLGGFVQEVDPSTQQVLVSVDRDKVSPELAAAIENISPGLVHVALGGETSRAIRTVADSTPHWGGSYIYSVVDEGYYCTSGFSVIKNSNNADAAVTAGHCSQPTPGLNNGQTFRSGIPSGTTYFYGDMWGNTNFPAFDMARLEGSTYAATIRTDGGNDGQLVRTVRGASNPVIGDLVCQSGVTSYAQCNLLVGALNAQLCDASGCTYGLFSARRDTDVIVRGGDSGAPVYLRFSGAEAGIRGMVIGAGDGGTRLLAAFWSDIRDHEDVRIKTAP